MSMTRPPDLPDFENPPVDEVVIGLSFMPINGFTSDNLADYREAVRHEFPGVQYQPRMAPTLESLTGDDFQSQPNPIFSVMAGGQAGQRTWLVGSDDERVLQIQDDCFYSNWRRRGNPYPRFEPLLDEFWKYFNLFRDQAAKASTVVHLQQLEITYINWVPITDRPLREWFRPAESSGLSIGPVSVDPQHHQWAAVYLIKERDIAVARLHARQIEALRTAPSPHLGAQLELVYRMPLPPGSDDAAITDFARLGRNTIVWAFTSLTTPTSHIAWKRRPL